MKKIILIIIVIAVSVIVAVGLYIWNTHKPNKMTVLNKQLSTLREELLRRNNLDAELIKKIIPENIE